MYLHRSYRLLFLLPLLMAGCSSTVSSRFGGTPHSRSIAVVGDRPMPAAAGEPGGRVVSDDAEPEPKRDPKTRISGRVVDEAGDPVENATVRLASGGKKGGKDIRGTTDRSGGFTLNGLRPGSTYSLIAEGEGDNGPLVGRAEAMTAETGIEISLMSEGTARSGSRRSSKPPRVKPVSNREGSAEPIDHDQTTRVNREDIPSSAVEDAETLDPGPTAPHGSSLPQLSPPQPGVGWRNRNTSTASRARDHDEDGETSSSDLSPGRRRASTETNPSRNDDEEVNPLPPAIDSGAKTSLLESETGPALTPRVVRLKRVAASPIVKSRDSGEIAIVPEISSPQDMERSKSFSRIQAEKALVEESRITSSLLPDLESTPSIDNGSVEVATTALPNPTEKLETNPTPVDPMALPPVGGESVASVDRPNSTTSPPGSESLLQAVVPTNPASEPVFASQGPQPSPVESLEKPVDYNPFASTDRANESSGLLPDPTPLDPPPSTERLPTPDVSAQVPDSAPKKKWGELAKVDRPAMVVEPTKVTAPTSLVKRLRTSVEKRDNSVATCSYDSKHLKINDFRLPDLDGRPVRFQDLDADFVLLDFWGTWCGPCLDSIPHLVELQKKYGPGQLKVVGIACEEVPPDQRKAKVDEVSRKLGINYPVLLSTMDGKPCPVQQALQIQAMPTMILVDRRGQVLWRNTGSTTASENRLDRVLALSIGRSETVRR